MPVSDGADAVAAVEVNVFPAVGVEDLRPFTVADPDHLRTRDLPARSRPARQNLPRLPDQSPRPRLTLLEPAFTLDDDLVEPEQIPLGPTAYGVHTFLL